MSKRVAIVGSEGSKFQDDQQYIVEALIQDILCDAAGLVMGESYRPKTEAISVVSGRCPLGGVDVWAENVAQSIGCRTQIFPPKTNSWAAGYKPRNIQIATVCTELHVIAVKELPPNWIGLAFETCYHCARRKRLVSQGGSVPDHIKSGACWTANVAQNQKKPIAFHVIGEYGDRVCARSVHL